MAQAIPHSMRVITTNEEMSQACREAAKPVALVPTMGALHEGHQQLIQKGNLCLMNLIQVMVELCGVKLYLN